MPALFVCNPEVLLDGKPLGFGHPRSFWIDHVCIKVPQELGDELVHFDQRNILTDTAATSHSELWVSIHILAPVLKLTLEWELTVVKRLFMVDIRSFSSSFEAIQRSGFHSSASSPNISFERFMEVALILQIVPGLM